jgi:rhodanese-related sulfurtransferase
MSDGQQREQAPAVEPSEADRLVAEGAFLLDVREPDEWAAGRAPAAVHIPIGQVIAQLDRLPADRPVVTVCRMGGRSNAVAVALNQRGYHALNLAGGMRAWAAAGLPVVDDRGDAGRVA